MFKNGLGVIPGQVKEKRMKGLQGEPLEHGVGFQLEKGEEKEGA